MELEGVKMDKRYVLKFKAANGMEFSLGADDLSELFNQPWFSGSGMGSQRAQPVQQSGVDVDRLVGILNSLEADSRWMMKKMKEIDERTQPKQESVPQSQVQSVPQQVQAQAQPSFLEVNPNDMTPQMWQMLNEAQKKSYYERWGAK